MAISSLAFGYFEILTGKVQFLNGDFRVAGPFRNHQLAFAMFLFCLLILYSELVIKSSSNHKRLLHILLFLSIFYLFIRTGSRALLVTYFISYLILYILTAEGFFQKLKVLTISAFIAFSGIVVILNTSISPRLRLALTSEKTIYDPSTLKRISIVTNSLDQFQKENIWFGIGLGGFNEFYFEAGGEKGIAAHNNYLLFLIEAGAIGLSIYIIYQLLFFLFILKLLIKFPRDPIVRSAFLLFIGIDVISFLQNNFYFFSSELVVWLVYGYSIGKYHVLKKNIQEPVELKSSKI
jgi:O-antigen ligase